VKVGVDGHRIFRCSAEGMLTPDMGNGTPIPGYCKILDVFNSQYMRMYEGEVAVPITGRGGLYGCEMLRIPHCLRWQGCQRYAPAALYSLETFILLLLVPVSVRTSIWVYI
jgi:hypothetical protein